ncbi:unnamed protein product [Linum trigynum]|uniref:Uncharacterized protein n=1 Tax=Linum trigynum TaxID=586398 RepID=A0AAV2EE34_9ROSI
MGNSFPLPHSDAAPPAVSGPAEPSPLATALWAAAAASPLAIWLWVGGSWVVDGNCVVGGCCVPLGGNCCFISRISI